MIVRRSSHVLTIAFAVCALQPLSAQEPSPADREALYRRCLDLRSYVKGGAVEPHWLVDSSSFWYADGAPENTVIWKVDPHRNTREPYTIPVMPSHQEMELLVKGGLTPLEALRAATLGPARYFGAVDSLGTVAEGRLADLVLLDANPLEDIRHTKRIHAVVLNGVLFDRAALDALLAGVEKATT